MGAARPESRLQAPGPGKPVLANFERRGGAVREVLPRDDITKRPY